MALGYEGLVRLGTQYVLGTGASVPRTRARLESSSGYGGNIKTPVEEMGVGSPFNYDWEEYDGSIDFEMTEDVLKEEVRPWIFDRQSVKEIEINVRLDNVQRLEKCLFSGITISTSEPSEVSGSVSFVGLQREEYEWGDLYVGNRLGLSNGKVCPPVNFPPTLNPDNENLNPIPFWRTKVLVTEEVSEVQKNFIEWSVSFSQSVNKFFGCNHTGGADPGPKAPLFMACGPLTVVFSGTYMDDFTGTENGFLGDHLAKVVVDVGGTLLKMKRLESSVETDAVQSPDSLTPLSVDYAAYELEV